MSMSSPNVTSRRDASAGPHEPFHELSVDVVSDNDSEPFHDSTSHDSIWSTHVPSYLKERVHLVPGSSSSSSSFSTSTTSRRRTKPKSKSKGFGHSRLAEPYREDQEVPSFCSAQLRPPASARISSNPALLTGRPLSMTEIMRWSIDECDEEYNPHEEDSKVLTDGARPRDENSSRPENLAPGPLRVRGRSRSSPGSTDPPKIPFSNFIDIWR